MNEPDIIPELKHCQDEVNAALLNKDIELLKSIFKREGVDWIDYDLPEKYKSCIFDCR